MDSCTLSDLEWRSSCWDSHPTEDSWPGARLQAIQVRHYMDWFLKYYVFWLFRRAYFRIHFSISTVAARQSKFIIRRLHFNEEMIKRENTIDDDVRMWNKPVSRSIRIQYDNSTLLKLLARGKYIIFQFLTINVRLIAVYGKQAVIIREIESEPFLFFVSILKTE